MKIDKDTNPALGVICILILLLILLGSLYVQVYLKDQPAGSGSFAPQVEESETEP